MQGVAAATLTASLLGTPRYISPEQAQGLPGEERTDLYSLGIILYEMVTGVTPFQGDNPIVIMMQHIHETPTPPILINPNIPSALSAVVLQSIAKDPAERFHSASAMTVALARALNCPVPASLDKPSALKVESERNPLQPSHVSPEITSYPIRPTASSPLLVTPPLESNVETNVTTPVNHTPTLVPTDGPLSGGQAPPASLAPAGKARRKGLYVALVACIIIILTGTGIGTLLLLTSHSQKGASATPNPSSTVVGQVVFISSHGTFDQVLVDLHGIPDPPAGQTYYAWLDSISKSEAIPALGWQLNNNHGVLHYLYPGDAQHTNLLKQFDQFLVTTEDTGSSPVIPYPNSRLYYALLSQDGSTTFAVKMCPSSSGNNASNPCR